MLKATFAEPMSADEIAAFREVAGGRDPPEQRVSEAVYIASCSGCASPAKAKARHATCSNYRHDLYQRVSNTLGRLQI